MTSSLTTKVPKNVILSDQSTWEPWFDIIKSSQEQYWRYFNPDGHDIYPEPVDPVQLPLSEQPPVVATPVATTGPSTRSMTPAGAATETPAQLAAQKARNKKQLEAYYKAFNEYNQQKCIWEKVSEAQSKLRDRIQSCVAQHNASLLDPDLTVRQWLQSLRESIAPPLATQQQTLRVDYQRFILVGYSDWPTGSPANWIGK